MTATEPTRDLLCQRLVPEIPDDSEAQAPCLKLAVAEVFTINGQWKPHCQRHAAPYGPDRVRFRRPDRTPREESR